MTDDVGPDHPGTVASGVDRGAPGDTALLLDVMLGKLATYLRMCGYDAEYALDGGDKAGESDGGRDPRADPGDDGLLARADAEGRVLLTRDVRLAERAPRSVLLAEREPIAQLRELESVGFAVSLDERPSRCGVCNGRAEAVGRDERVPDYAPDPAETALWRCRDCGQVFWRGSHWRDVEARWNGEEG
ncbi:MULTISPECIES: Mut7-C RNAse domain-containing protein [Haloferax]|uniref:Mut7-C RNAse domain-containing protein n=1 Tax=Haloferax massiliensis TaxID=1476858 RepID=A0A0D6JS73_9EURY|nr:MULTISPECIES: Mut7-C RNAse domain-containing protein [Haloferax]MDS0240655.1 Mut7-C RNAse domain-containing protein [Haloferax sp. S2CR25]MDS0443776.1 Mut7-C RNAse domain-containing protein [Haloferax sp. S2CR25-2]CQR50776.1 hypothetical protein BN996_02259 [Haloferax massiliensis]